MARDCLLDIGAVSRFIEDRIRQIKEDHEKRKQILKACRTVNSLQEGWDDIHEVYGEDEAAGA